MEKNTSFSTKTKSVKQETLKSVNNTVICNDKLQEQKNDKQVLIYISHDDQHIALCSECIDTQLSNIFTTTDPQCFPIRLERKLLDKCDELKSSISGGFIIKHIKDLLKDDTLKILKTSGDSEDSVLAICYKDQGSSGVKLSGKEEYCRLVLKLMQHKDIEYLEFESPRVTRSSIRQDASDVDEDSGAHSTTEDSECSPFFSPVSSSATDPKKTPEFLRLLNKIRELHQCPMDIPRGPPQGSTPVGGGNDDDLEVDADPETLEDNTRESAVPIFGMEAIPSKESKSSSFSGQQGKSDTNFRNVTYLLGTPSASYLIEEIGYERDLVLQAISDYTRVNGNVEFDENALITFIENDVPKIAQEQSLK